MISGALRPAVAKFAHESERHLAALFESLDIEYSYEPVEFTLDWDGSGRAISGFRPDFYLPAYNLFVELTTLRQTLVTKKNRKLRRLRELHPDINIQMLYRRDYFELLLSGRLTFLDAALGESRSA